MHPERRTQSQPTSQPRPPANKKGMSEDEVLGRLSMCVAIFYLAAGLIYLGGTSYALHGQWEVFRSSAPEEYGEIPGLPRWMLVAPALMVILVAIPEIVFSWAVWKGKKWGYYGAIVTYVVACIPYGILGAPKLLMAGLLIARLRGFLKWSLWQDPYIPPPPLYPPYQPPPQEPSSRERPKR
jgi:hypothetical protein